MSLDHPVIAVIGAGAVGGYYGGRLAQHGFEVHFHMRSDYAAARKNGLRVKSCDGDFLIAPQQLRVYNDVRQMPKADLVIITLKTTANDQYDSLIRPLIKDETVLLTLQNGLNNEEQLATLFGKERVVGGMAFVCINRLEGGIIHHMDHGLIRIGEYASKPQERTQRIADMFNQSKVRCEVLPDLLYGRWLKLVWNIPFNGLGAVMDLTTDLLVGPAAGEALIRAIMTEVVTAARAVGAALPDEVIQRNIDQTKTMGPYKSSMHIDRQMGRRLEVEAIFGNALRAAQQAGVPTHHMQMLYQQVKLLDDAIASQQ